MAATRWKTDTELTERELVRLRELLIAVRAADGRPEIDADGPLPGDFRGGEHLLDAVGYAHLNTSGDTFGRQVGELFTRPDSRGHGVGGRLLAELLDHAAEDVRIWSHGDHPAAAALARRFGLRRVRELHRMLLDPLPAELPDRPLPAGVRLRPFVPGQDEPAVIEVNKRAFAWHPEQGALTVDELRATESEPWFDPAGFLLAVDTADAADTVDRLVGFHWTKIHPSIQIGEVYVLAVDPDAHGGGLGTALTLAGLRYLAGRSLRRVMLYVEGDNQPAIALYTKLGFGLWDMDVQYAR
ncbi:MAG TPA: mycothiol synthase [Pseudonocardiaceae bacterium]|nr:mycothiol synthase [Pseudonocardiaceae bacterium]